MDSVLLLSERLNSKEVLAPVKKVYETDIVEKESVCECNC